MNPVPQAEDISRTALLLLNGGVSLEEAEATLAAERIAIVAGPECATSVPHQAALLTAVNTARRAVGNVPIVATADTLAAAVLAGPFRGMTISAALERLRATPVDTIDTAGPILAIGRAGAPSALRVTWTGWTAAVHTDTDCMLAEDDDMPLAPIAAAALGVSEAFQRLRGHPEAGRRDVTLPLWNPTASDPTTTTAPRVEWLPSEWALIGLGHLGQAYSWTIAFLPYDDPAHVHIRLQDTDRVTKATLSTGLLTFDADVEKMKTRVVAAALEKVGFSTAILEQRLIARDFVHPGEPLVAVIGVDNVATRRLLSDVGWKLCIDAGLGRNIQNYTKIRLQAFPGPQRSDQVPAWQNERPPTNTVPKNLAYETLRTTGVDECGLITIADKAVAVTFVGTIAACLAIAEPLRTLHHSPALGIQTIDLSSPNRVRGDRPEPRVSIPLPALRRS